MNVLSNPVSPRAAVCYLVASFLIPAGWSSAHAQADRIVWTYTKVADVYTDLPNWPPGGDKGYTEPSLDNDIASFRCTVGGGGWPYFCFYTTTLDGEFEPHVDSTTSIPGTDDHFGRARGHSLSNGVMAFLGQGFSSPGGIYKKSLGSNDIDVVMNEQTGIPDGIGTFNGWESPSLASGTTVFFGWGTTGTHQEGIYAEVDGSLRAVADLNTEMPNHVGVSFDTFAQFPTSGGRYIAFCGYDNDSDARGVYRYSVDNDSIEVVADDLTDVPGVPARITNEVSSRIALGVPYDVPDHT